VVEVVRSGEKNWSTGEGVEVFAGALRLAPATSSGALACKRSGTGWIEPCPVA
jgi:hypothetical protein